MKRLNFLDIVRTVSIFPIVHFHTWEIVFFENKLLADFFYQPHYSMYNYSRYFSFSGFTIVFLFYFLLGYKQEKKEGFDLKLPLMFSGLVGLSLVGLIAFQTDLLFEWDIYHFLILSYGLFYLLQHKLKPKLLHIGIWFVVSCLPYWNFSYDGVGAAALIGDCSEGTGMWPLLPGIFFTFLAYCLGKHMRSPSFKLKGRTALCLLVMSLLGFFVVSLQHFRHTPIGSGFGCFIHRPPEGVWIMTVLSMAALFVSSTHPVVNSNFLVVGVAEKLAGLMWNRRFGLCYLTQWFFLLILYLNKGYFAQNPGYFYLAPLAVISLTELVVRVALYLFSKRSISLK